MRYRVKTILAVITVVALLLGFANWAIRNQQRIAKLEAQIALLEAKNKQLQAETQLLIQFRDSRSHVGVPWNVERAMLLDATPNEDLRR